MSIHSARPSSQALGPHHEMSLQNGISWKVGLSWFPRSSSERNYYREVPVRRQEKIPKLSTPWMAPYVIFTSTVRGRGIPRIPLAQTRSCGQSWKLTKHLVLEQLWEHLAQALSWQGNCGPLSHGWLMTALGVKFNNSVPIQGILSFQGNNSLYIGPKKKKRQKETITYNYVGLLLI